MVGEKGMVEKAKNIVFDNESGLYWSKYFGDWWLVDNLDAKEAAAAGLVPKDHEFYSDENRKIMANRKEEAKKADEKSRTANAVPPSKKVPPHPASSEVATPDPEREDAIEAIGVSENSDMVLQYAAVFTAKNGEKTVRKWLSVNAWKLGLIEGYIKAGYGCSISYENADNLVKCHIKLKKGDQEVVSEGTYTKNRLRSFLSSSKDECFETFAFRNAIKKIVSLKDVVTAVKSVQGEIEAIGFLPTKEVKQLGE